MSEKPVGCFAHWERRGEAVSEGLHLVHGEWMCEPCFTGRPLPVRRDYDDGKKDSHCNPARDAHARTQARVRKRKSLLCLSKVDRRLLIEMRRLADSDRDREWERLLQESEREGDPGREAQPPETRRARLPKVLDGRGYIVRQHDSGTPGVKATPSKRSRNRRRFATSTRMPARSANGGARTSLKLHDGREAGEVLQRLTRERVSTPASAVPR